MLRNISHSGGVTNVDEVLFSTPFGYMFPELADNPECRLGTGQDTTRALIDLGTAMATDAVPDNDPTQSETDISSFFTYFGQFIDHDLTARTDRETEVSEIFSPDGGALPIRPQDPSDVVLRLKNGRRAQLDLDSVYGDGPGLVQGPGAETGSQDLYNSGDAYTFKLQRFGTAGIDLPRPKAAAGEIRPNPRNAMIADMRNDENIVISQIQASFLAFHNAIMDGLESVKGGEGQVKGPLAFVRARQYVRWVYQYIVVEQYLRTVCMPAVVDDVLRNGPSFYGAVAGGQPLFMPLEFSAAGFRFGHSMIRPVYTLRGTTALITEILGVSTRQRPKDADGNQRDILCETPNGDYAFQLYEQFTVDWSKFFDAKPANTARSIDPLIAKGLESLTFTPKIGTVMSHLAIRNLLRGFSLSLPTGQSVAAALGIRPIKPEEMVAGLSDKLFDAVNANSMAQRTPLWFYVLREAQLQTGGRSLGVVGSRIVAETIVGILKKDPNSILNQYGDSRNITKSGIEVPTKDGRRRVHDMQGMLYCAGVFPGGESHAPLVDPRDRDGRVVEAG